MNCEKREKTLSYHSLSRFSWSLLKFLYSEFMNREKKYKFAFLINPMSGSGHAKKILDQLPSYLARINLSKDHYHIEQTRIGQVQEQANNLSRHSTTLIAIGGDGTVSDVVAGIYYGDPTTKLGIVPLGTANDLARSLKIYQLFNSKPFDIALIELLSLPSAPLDVWKINGCGIMSNYLSLGLDAAVAAGFGQTRRNRNMPRMTLQRTKVEFVINGLRKITHRISPGSSLYFHHNEQKHKIPLGRMRSVLFSNINSIGAGTTPLSGTDHGDGFLDITLFPDLARLLGFFITQNFGIIQRLYSRCLDHHRANHVEITPAPGNYLQIDGEDKTSLLEQGKLTIENAGQIRALTYVQ